MVEILLPKNRFNEALVYNESLDSISYEATQEMIDEYLRETEFDYTYSIKPEKIKEFIELLKRTNVLTEIKTKEEQPKVKKKYDLMEDLAEAFETKIKGKKLVFKLGDSEVFLTKSNDAKELHLQDITEKKCIWCILTEANTQTVSEPGIFISRDYLPETKASKLFRFKKAGEGYKVATVAVTYSKSTTAEDLFKTIMNIKNLAKWTNITEDDEEICKLIIKSTENSISNVQDKIEELTKEQQEITKSLYETAKMITSFTKQKDLLELAKTDGKSYAESILAQMKIYPEIKALYTEESHETLVIETGIMRAFNTTLQTSHLIGELVIKIRNGSVTIYNNWGQIADKNLPHGHGGSGTVCLGNIAHDIPYLAGIGDYVTLIEYLLNFVQTANMNDTYGLTLPLWPLDPFDVRNKVFMDNMNNFNLLAQRASRNGLFGKATPFDMFKAIVQSEPEKADMPLLCTPYEHSKGQSDNLSTWKDRKMIGKTIKEILGEV